MANATTKQLIGKLFFSILIFRGVVLTGNITGGIQKRQKKLSNRISKPSRAVDRKQNFFSRMALELFYHMSFARFHITVNDIYHTSRTFYRGLEGHNTGEMGLNRVKVV